MSKPAFDNRHYFGILAVALICSGAGFFIGAVVVPGICRTASTGFPFLGIIAAGIYAPMIVTAWRHADTLGCKRPLAVRVAGIMTAIFAAAVLQPMVDCSVEPDYGPIGAAISLFALWFAVLLFAHLYVGRYAEALRRRYDSRNDKAAA